MGKWINTRRAYGKAQFGYWLIGLSFGLYLMPSAFGLDFGIVNQEASEDALQESTESCAFTNVAIQATTSFSQEEVLNFRDHIEKNLAEARSNPRLLWEVIRGITIQRSLPNEALKIARNLHATKADPELYKLLLPLSIVVVDLLVDEFVRSVLRDEISIEGKSLTVNQRVQYNILGILTRTKPKELNDQIGQIAKQAPNLSITHWLTLTHFKLLSGQAPIEIIKRWDQVRTRIPSSISDAVVLALMRQSYFIGIPLDTVLASFRKLPAKYGSDENLALALNQYFLLASPENKLSLKPLETSLKEFAGTSTADLQIAATNSLEFENDTVFDARAAVGCYSPASMLFIYDLFRNHGGI